MRADDRNTPATALKGRTPRAGSAGNFTLRLIITLIAAVAGAVLISPLAAWVVGACGFHFPFPRIFDRVVMLTTIAALCYNAAALRLLPRLAGGFADPAAGLRYGALGLLIGVVAVGSLYLAAWATAPDALAERPHLFSAILKYAAAALIVGVLEEAFFRAFLLDGLTEDWGANPALAGSAAVYALAHFVRAPARYEIHGLLPMAGVRNLSHSLDRLAHPAEAIPGLLGLFLLGLVFGVAYLSTHRVYLAAGLHAALVLGAKSWRKLVAGGAILPGWLVGYGYPPLISGPAAWMLALVLLVLVRTLAKPSDDSLGRA